MGDGMKRDGGDVTESIVNTSESPEWWEFIISGSWGRYI